MNLLLLEGRDFFAENRARITGRRLEQMRGVWHAVPGGVCRVGLLDGPVGCGRILAIDERSAELETNWNGVPPPPLPVTLIAALPRPKTMLKVLHCAASMGVKRIFFIESWKVDKSYWNTPLLEPGALHEQLLLGLEQGCDTVLPHVETRRRFKPFVEDELSVLSAGTRLLVGHPAAKAAFPRRPGGPVTLLFGPEGGFTEYEIGLLAANGATAVSFGPRPLRTEFAVAAMLGAFDFSDVPPERH